MRQRSARSDHPLTTVTRDVTPGTPGVPIDSNPTLRAPRHRRSPRTSRRLSVRLCSPSKQCRSSRVISSTYRLRSVVQHFVVVRNLSQNSIDGTRSPLAPSE